MAAILHSEGEESEHELNLQKEKRNKDTHEGVIIKKDKPLVKFPHKIKPYSGATVPYHLLDGE